MALTDTSVKNIEPGSTAAGDKHSDAGRMYLLVNAGGKYWRLNYRFDSKQKRLCWVSTLRCRCSKPVRSATRHVNCWQMVCGIAKKEDRQAKAAATAYTFERVARQVLEFTALKFQFLKPFSLRGVHVTELGVRLVERGVTEAVFAANLLDRNTGLNLA